MSRWPLVLSALACTQCSNAARGDEAAPAESARTRYHMREHLADLREIERLLVAGKLADARNLAFFLSRQVAPSPRTPEVRDLELAAGSLARARTLDEALHEEVRVAAACASCHVAAQKLPVFKAPTNAPRDLPTREAQMARHQWAADRLWEGLIGASDEHWRIALDVLGTTVIPASARPRPAALGTQLQRLALAARDRTEPWTVDARATTYADLLVTCAGCHAMQPSPGH